MCHYLYTIILYAAHRKKKGSLCEKACTFHIQLTKENDRNFQEKIIKIYFQFNSMILLNAVIGFRILFVF